MSKKYGLSAQKPPNPLRKALWAGFRYATLIPAVRVATFPRPVSGAGNGIVGGGRMAWLTGSGTSRRSGTKSW